MSILVLHITGTYTVYYEKIIIIYNVSTQELVINN